MKRVIVASAVVLVLFLLAGPSPAGTHEDEQLGYRVKVPSSWDEIPVKITEKWIVARFLCAKEFRTTGVDNWPITHKPEMRVIVFPFSVTKGSGERTIETEGGTIVFRDLSNPYKDYRDYLKRTYSGGGWFISTEEENTRKDLAWTLLEIKVEKLARSGTKRIVAGVFHAEDADFVVQFEVLEDAYGKLKGTIYASLDSFEFIPRKGSLAPETTEGRPAVNEEDLTPAERRKRRVARVQRAYEQSAERLPRGWDTFEYKDYFFVLSHVDRKYANMVCKHGESIWKWLDKSLGYLGDEEPRPIIIRICATPEEERTYHGTGGGDFWFSSSGAEVVMSRGEGLSFGRSPFGELNNRILANWMQDKAPEFFWKMPSWLRWGLRRLVSSAWMEKSGRLVFSADISQRRQLAIAASKGELFEIRDVLTTPQSEIGDAYDAQTSALIRFLLDGPGRRSGGGKEFLPKYIEAAKAYAEGREKDEADVVHVEPTKEPETEEEEEAMLRKRREGRNDWEAKETEHLRAIFERAFSDWSESKWKGLEKMYRRYAIGK